MKYTNITHQDILEDLKNKLKSDDRFSNFTDADITTLLLDLMAGTIDYANYNIERAVEEQFYNTGKRYRGHVKLANNQGYDIKRPIPSSANIRIEVTKDSSFPDEGDIPFDDVRNIEIPQYTDFSYNGLKYILKDSISYELNAEALRKLARGEKIIINSIPKKGTFVNDSVTEEITETSPITLLQGVFRIIKIIPEEVAPDKNGKIKFPKFQKYFIEDPTFSNLYGEYDLIDGKTTVVAIGINESDAFSGENIYSIERSSLLSSDALNDYYKRNTDFKELKKVVLIRTSAESFDGMGVELRFGDGEVISSGIDSEDLSLFVRYLSTNGAEANETGVINNSLTIVNDADWILKDDLKLKAFFETNITGGADLESLDSIGVNAPGVYQTFDRLVSKKDYFNFMKSLTAPILVKNAIAWGEQEELENIKYLTDETENISFNAIKKLSNVMLFTVLGDLYENNDLRKDLDDQVLDAGYSPYQIPGQSYVNIVSSGDIVGQIKFNQINFDGTIPIMTAFQNKTSDSKTMYYGADKFLNQIKDLDIECEIELIPKDSSENSRTFKGISKVFNDQNLNPSYAAILNDLEIELNRLIDTGLNGSITNTSYIELSSNLEKDIKYWNDNGENQYTYPSPSYKLKVEGNYVNDTIPTHKFDDIKIKVKFIWPENVDEAISNDIGEDPFKFEEMSTFKSSEQSIYPGLVTSSKIEQFIKYLKPRSMVTEQPIYVSPVIHDFALVGKINIKNLINRTEIEKEIKTKVYNFLSERNDFGKSLYLSNIIEIIESFDEVINVNVKLEPLETVELYKGQTQHLDQQRLANLNHYIYTYLEAGDANYARSYIFDSIYQYLNKYELMNNSQIGDKVLEITDSIIYGDSHKLYDLSQKISAGFTERSFMYELVAPMIEKLKDINTLNSSPRAGAPITRTPEFFMLLSDIHNDFKEIIKYNMLTKNGDIANEYYEELRDGVMVKIRDRGGYTLNNEIIRIKFNALVGYKD